MSKRGLAPERSMLRLTFIPASDGQMHDGGFRRATAECFADDAPVAEHQYAMADAREFLDFRRSEQHRGAGRRDLANEIVNLRLGADVHRRGRRIQHEDLGAAGEPAAENRLLLIAAA